ncbi:hypothetical protein SLEP1_g49917 [Rubroshorea leprosula]|uniref:TF-B3 domain-containing protein n=1 Tax=Rubroshorea leprosula TaxID=152421 RepID=A0AAV5LZ95_9ROSI|nr:hypothetical protein SLEP1_g49917 [Rubroshorea leprosula]
MASNANENTCFHCKVATDELRPGWGRRFGGFVMLCHRCASAYEDGTFCSIFHPDASGWRVCATCDKPLHCGCIMSALTHTILDLGGVQCMDCVANRVLPPRRLPPSRNPAMGPSEVRLSADSIPPSSTVTYGLPNKTTVQFAPGAALEKKASLHGIGEDEPSVNSPDENDTSSNSDKDTEKPERSTIRKAYIHARNMPKRNDEELEQLSKESKSVFIPLFEKALTASDAEPKNGRLILPKRCAEAYLPKVTAQQRVPIKVQDTRGNDWQFYYRIWANSNGRMYVLEGLKEYVNMIQWEAGDTVVFYRREPEGNLVIGVSRAQAGESGQKSSA